MPEPIVYEFPVRRPGFITQAQWIGGDDDLALQLTYTGVGGGTQSVSLTTRNPDNLIADIALPSGMTVDDMKRDLIVAHIRMATFVSKTVAGSEEWQKAFIEQAGARHFQTPIGNVKVTDVRMTSDVEFELDIKKTGGGPTRTLTSDHSEMSRYTFTPSTQLLIVGGAVWKDFGSYHHDYPNEVLSAQQKQDIVDYVLTLEPWI